MKKSNAKKFLAGSVVVALLIMIGGTFAWFTSQDEVTNRLTANNQYGVSITESFKPTENWIPGQEVEKDVSVINTGNIDAFVKVALSNTLSVTKVVSSDNAVSSGIPDDAVVLSDEEVVALQAGAYQFNMEPTDDDDEVWLKIESGEALKVEGLNVFRRQISVAENGTETYKYKGYYYDGDKYYGVIIDGDEATKFAATKFQTLVTVYDITETENDDGAIMAMDYSKATSDNVITATYDPDENVDGDEIIIDINLAEDWEDNWKFDADNNVFYYNKLLIEGDQTKSLVASLKLDESVSNEAYYTFTYDLTVSLDSAQATGEPDERNHYTGKDVVNNDVKWTMKVTDVSWNEDNTDDTYYAVTWAAKASD